MIKYKWQVQPEPTGRYRSFETRGWPNAVTPDDGLIAFMVCTDEYKPSQVKIGNHAPIKIKVRVKKDDTWQFSNLKGEWATVQQAKAAFALFIENYPNHDFGITPAP